MISVKHRLKIQPCIIVLICFIIHSDISTTYLEQICYKQLTIVNVKHIFRQLCRNLLWELWHNFATSVFCLFVCLVGFLVFFFFLILFLVFCFCFVLFCFLIGSRLISLLGWCTNKHVLYVKLNSTVLSLTYFTNKKKAYVRDLHRKRKAGRIPLSCSNIKTFKRTTCRYIWHLRVLSKA